jgi:cell division topological specificity factor
MLNELLERFFRRSKDKDSRAEVKQRLKFLIAHDRADLPPAMVESMQREILEVVSRYVEVDKEALSFSLESDRRTTALLANFPILRIKDNVEETEAESPEMTASTVEESDEDTSGDLKFDDEEELEEAEESDVLEETEEVE